MDLLRIKMCPTWIFLLVSVCFVSLTDALNCYQCNVFVRGTPWPCNSEKGMRQLPDCLACLKTFTKSYLHNTFHDVVLSTYESRVCVRDRNSIKDAGCHNYQTDSGYMKRCFCFDDLCNSSPVTSLSVTTALGSVLLTSILRQLL